MNKNIEAIEENNSNIPNMSFNFNNTELLSKNINTNYSLLNDTLPISNTKKYLNYQAKKKYIFK